MARPKDSRGPCSGRKKEKTIAGEEERQRKRNGGRKRGKEQEGERDGGKDLESIILSCVWLASLIIFIIYIHINQRISRLNETNDIREYTCTYVDIIVNTYYCRKLHTILSIVSDTLARAIFVREFFIID